MEKIRTILYRIIFLGISIFSLAGSAKAQYYEWANAPAFILHGSYGSFKSTDMHGNGYYIGLEVPIHGYYQTVLRSFGQNGLINWSLHYSYIYPPVFLAVDADSAGNRYVLVDKKLCLTNIIDNFTITEDFALLKYNSSGTLIRATGLNERFDQIKVDSIGNAFISTGTKVIRYNKFGLLSWQYITPFVHTLYVDNAKNNFLVNDSIAIKLNPSGVLKYTHVEQGPKAVDSKGRLYVSSTGGMKRYDKFGIFQFIRPAITGTIQTNNNGNIYEFKNDSVLKYNQSGTTVQWLFDDSPSKGIVNVFGDIYFGGNYDIFHDDLQLCPFRIPSVPYTYQVDANQVWVAKLNGKDQPPFQAAVYTNLVRNDAQTWTSEPNLLCGSLGGIEGTGTPLSNSSLFDYCTNSSSYFSSGNQFSIEISDNSGSFFNAINLGNPATAIVPYSIDGFYKVRIVSSTPGVTYHPNLPYDSYYVKINPNIASLSVSGTQNLCENDSLLLTITCSDTSGYIRWYNSGNFIQGGFSNNYTVDTSGYYYANVWNHGCYRNSDTLYVNLNPRPSPTISPSGPFNICGGESVELEVSDVDLTSIAWKNNGTLISAANDTAYTVLSSGGYSSIVTNQFGCKNTTATVLVHVSPPCRLGQFDSENSTIQIYPNPVFENTNVTIFGLTEGENLISIRDASGKEVFKQTIFSEKHSQITIPFDQFLNGMYVVKVINRENIFTEVLVKVE